MGKAECWGRKKQYLVILSLGYNGSVPPNPSEKMHSTAEQEPQARVTAPRDPSKLLGLLNKPQDRISQAWKRLVEAKPACRDAIGCRDNANTETITVIC